MENNLMESKKVRKSNTWLEHVKAFREEHSELSYKDVLKQAKDTYKPIVDQVNEKSKEKSKEQKKEKIIKTKSKKLKKEIEATED